MQGDYPADQGFRPRRTCHHEQVEPRSGRLFLCAACRAQAIICSHCDRGQIYCNGGCGVRARRRTARKEGSAFCKDFKQRGDLLVLADRDRHRSELRDVDVAGLQDCVRQADTQHGAVDLIGDGTDKTGAQAEYTRRCEHGQNGTGLIGRALEPGPPEGGDQMSPFPGVGPRSWTGSGSCFDRGPGVLFLELRRAPVAER